MGCCLVVLAAWISPRFALALLWIFTDRLDLAFRSGIVGVAGFLFLPWTSLMWALAYHPVLGVTDVGWLFVLGGVLADVSSYAGGKRGRWRRDGD